MAGNSFPLIDEFVGLWLDSDVSTLLCGKIQVIESCRRLKRDEGYRLAHGLRWIWLTDGRSAVSVPPEAAGDVSKFLYDVRNDEEFFDPVLAEKLMMPVNAALRRAGLNEVDRVFRDVVFACNGWLLRRHHLGKCRALTDGSIPAAEGLELPVHCFPDGIVYGVIDEGKIVSVAYAHQRGVMEDKVADLVVVTAPAYRKRGYGKTTVSAVVRHITQNGGEALYGCSPDNQASTATARSVGFVPYGKSLIFTAPAPDRNTPKIGN